VDTKHACGTNEHQDLSIFISPFVPTLFAQRFCLFNTYMHGSSGRRRWTRAGLFFEGHHVGISCSCVVFSNFMGPMRIGIDLNSLERNKTNGLVLGPERTAARARAKVVYTSGNCKVSTIERRHTHTHI